MGQIATILYSLKPQIDQIMYIADKYSTSHHNRELANEVYSCFSCLKPLSHKHRIVWYLKGGDRLCISEWISVKPKWREKGGYVDDPERFLSCIVQYGDVLAPYVRTSIRSYFSDLVALAKQLKPYPSEERIYVIDGERVLNFVNTSWDDKLIFEQVLAKKISLHVGSLKYVSFYVQRKGKYEWIGFPVEKLASYIALEDFLDILLKIFSSIKDEVEALMEHNKPIIQKMKDVAAIWKVCKTLQP